MNDIAFRTATLNRVAGTLGVLALAVACNEVGGPADEESFSHQLGDLIVSEPGLGPGGSPGGAGLSVTYVSLPPGTLPLASSVRIRNLTIGEPGTPPIPVIDGGFDPVPIQADVGHELELTVTGENGATTVFLTRVPPRRSPSVVRTNPPKGRTDVALSVRPAVIFSEPIDPSSLSTTSIQLLRNGTVVAGSVALDSGAGWFAEFTPASRLEPGVTYELVVTRDIRDLNGDPLGEPVRASFVTTSAPDESQRGQLIVSNATTGSAFDPDGFTVTIDGGRTATLELNENVTFNNLTQGPHTVALGGISSNCSVNGAPVRTIALASGETAQFEFAISCDPSPELASIRIVFARATRDFGFRAGSAIVAMNADGSDRVQLTSGSSNDYGPDVSPDGRKIAFMRDPLGVPWLGSEIHVMNTDGSAVTRLAGTWSYDPDWSPDGTKITFSTVEGHWGGPIHVMQADGSGASPLTGPDPIPEDAWPAWSPDGTRIAFTHAEIVSGTLTSIWIMGADGKNAARLTESRLYGGSFPVWSPDGTRIAFSDAVGDYPALTSRIRVMNANGSAEASVLESDVQLIVSDWSEDGRMLLFMKRLRTGPLPRTDIYLLRLDDGTVVRLTADGAINETATFWPSAR